MAHAPKQVAPNRHFFRAVFRHVQVALDSACDVVGWYLPPFFLASIVRSGGGVFRASVAGPPPLPSLPWQTSTVSDVHLLARDW